VPTDGIHHVLNLTTEHVDLPEQLTIVLRDAFMTAPAYVNHVGSLGITTMSAGGNAAVGAVGASRPLQPVPRNRSGGRSPQISHMGSRVPSQPPNTSGPAASQTTRQHVPNMPDNNSEHHIYLRVEPGGRQFTGLDCSRVQNDLEFFGMIKTEYNSIAAGFDFGSLHGVTIIASFIYSRRPV